MTRLLSALRPRGTSQYVTDPRPEAARAPAVRSGDWCLAVRLVVATERADRRRAGVSKAQLGRVAGCACRGYNCLVERCARCGASLGAGHRFCADCGAPVGGCPSCGEPAIRRQAGSARRAVTRWLRSVSASSAAASAPGAVSAAGPVAERRVCSVLFCDVVGFTPLSESRDPEAVRELLSEYFAVARTVVGRYGGVVEKFIGDAVMAVWGTPVAIEGDAERAVRAGLDLVAAVAGLGAEAGVAGLAARAGVVTGEVAVTLGATDEGMVAGDAVNTAARVQAAAGPGQVLADGATRRLAGSAIGFADAGEHALKGKAEPAAAVAGDAGAGGGGRVPAGGWAGGAADRPGRRTAHGQGVVSCGGRSGGCRGWCWCPGRPGWASRGWAGSSRSTSMAWWRRCGGTGAGACRMGRGWRSGRWPR